MLKKHAERNAEAINAERIAREGSELIFKLAIDVECRGDDLPSGSGRRSVNIPRRQRVTDRSRVCARGRP